MSAARTSRRRAWRSCDDSYQLAFGKLTLDLTELPLSTEPITWRRAVGARRPARDRARPTQVQVDTEVGVGFTYVLGDSEGGTDLSNHYASGDFGRTRSSWTSRSASAGSRLTRPTTTCSSSWITERTDDTPCLRRRFVRLRRALPDRGVMLLSGKPERRRPGMGRPGGSHWPGGAHPGRHGAAPTRGCRLMRPRMMSRWVTAARPEPQESLPPSLSKAATTISGCSRVIAGDLAHADLDARAVDVGQLALADAHRDEAVGRAIGGCLAPVRSSPRRHRCSRRSASGRQPTARSRRSPCGIASTTP